MVRELNLEPQCSGLTLYEQVADDAKVWDVYAEYLQRRGFDCLVSAIFARQRTPEAWRYMVTTACEPHCHQPR
jgi:hypothetical protein